MRVSGIATATAVMMEIVSAVVHITVPVTVTGIVVVTAIGRVTVSATVCWQPPKKKRNLMPWPR